MVLVRYVHSVPLRRLAWSGRWGDNQLGVRGRVRYVVALRASVLVAIAGVVLLALPLESPAGGQAGPTPVPRPGAPSPTPSERVEADKAPSSRLAESDPELVARNDAQPVPVMIKLDFDSQATYQGGVEGFAATSPSATGRELSSNSTAERDYEAYQSQREDEIVAEIRRQVPQTQIGRSFHVVYGGVSAVVPANQIEALLGVEGVVAVQANELRQPLTDSSPEFLGAPTIYSESAPPPTPAKASSRQPRHRHLAGAPVLRRSRQPARAAGPCPRMQLGDNPPTAAVDVFGCQTSWSAATASRDWTPSRWTTRTRAPPATAMGTGPTRRAPSPARSSTTHRYSAWIAAQSGAWPPGPTMVNE